jgi:predicted nucleic acid-binding protein
MSRYFGSQHRYPTAKARYQIGQPIVQACRVQSAGHRRPSTQFEVRDPRGMVDCMIASVARRHGASLLTTDADLSRVARFVEIDLDDASITPRPALLWWS